MTGDHSPYRYALIALLALVTGLLLVMSWPRLRASVHYLPVDTAMSNYWESRELDDAQVEGLILRAEEAIAIHDHYRYWAGLSELKIISSQSMSKSLWQRRQALESAIETAEEAVRRAPSNPRVWLRIARTKEVLGRPAQQIIPPMVMSILTGRVEPTLMLARLELGLRHLSSMNEANARLLQDQVVLTWSMHQRAMAARIKSGNLNLDVLRGVLDQSQAAIIAEMEAGHAK
jgi:hypothetical protein